MGPLDYILNWIFTLFMQKMWFSMSCFATPKLLTIGFKRTWGPKMLGNDICDLDWWFYVIWNRFLALNRQIFHLISWKMLRIIINRMSQKVGGFIFVSNIPAIWIWMCGPSDQVTSVNGEVLSSGEARTLNGIFTNIPPLYPDHGPWAQQVAALLLEALRVRVRVAAGAC